tara:strand:+ start:298 stop:864 length:567 start_codon:yes stop_codon:yes gene_type:complete
MKTREVPEIAPPPNLKAYEEKFGHRQSPEASRAHPRAVLDQMAKEALEKGEPIPQWRDRHKTRLGNVNDQRYKSLKWESKYEELAWHKSMSETLKTYLLLFGHAPDKASYQKLTTKQIDRLAKSSLKTGFPVKIWKESSPYPLSLALDLKALKRLWKMCVKHSQAFTMTQVSTLKLGSLSLQRWRKKN